MKPFYARPLQKKTFIQLLLRQEPIENAIIELNNLLATQSLENISKRDVQSIEERYHLRFLQIFKLNLEEFYATLSNYLNNNESKTEDEDNLKKLQSILSLSNESILKITKMLYQQTSKAVSQEVNPIKFGVSNADSNESSFERTIRELVSNRDIEGAFAVLKENARFNPLLLDEIAFHWSSYTALMEKERLHLLSPHELELKWNRLIKGILDLSRLILSNRRLYI